MRARILRLAGIGVAAIPLSCGGSSSVPAPASTPPPGCTLGNGTYAATCTRQSTVRLSAYVDQAIEKVIHDYPSVFDLNNEREPGSRQYRVTNVPAYFTE